MQSFEWNLRLKNRKEHQQRGNMIYKLQKILFMVLLSRIEIGWFRVFTNERKVSFCLLYLKIAININSKTSLNGQIDIVCRLSWAFQTIRWNNCYILFVQCCIFEILWHTQGILQLTEFMHWNVKRLICTEHWSHCFRPY